MTMNRRDFLVSAAALTLASKARLRADSAPGEHRFPPDVIKNEWYVEAQPIPQYHWAPASAYEALRDMTFGIEAKNPGLFWACRSKTGKLTTSFIKRGILPGSMRMSG